MGIIIIDPPEKPKAADALDDDQWKSVWRYCSLHTQANLPADRAGSSFAAFAIGLVIGGLAGAAAMAASVLH